MNRIRPKLVAITGGSGSGKSWLADRLQAALTPNLNLTPNLSPHIQRLSLDAFYIDRSHLSPARRECINYDHPRCIDWKLLSEVLNEIRRGRPTPIPRYDFASHSRLETSATLTPARLVLVDGLWLLRRPDLRPLFDLAIFLDCPASQRLRWRLARDTAERGRSENSVRRQFRSTVEPMHSRFVATQKRYADLVLRQPLQSNDIDRLYDGVWTVMAADGIYSARSREALRVRLHAVLATPGQGTRPTGTGGALRRPRTPQWGVPTKANVVGRVPSRGEEDL